MLLQPHESSTIVYTFQKRAGNFPAFCPRHSQYPFDSCLKNPGVFIGKMIGNPPLGPPPRNSNPNQGNLQRLHMLDLKIYLRFLADECVVLEDDDDAGENTIHF